MIIWIIYWFHHFPDENIILGTSLTKWTSSLCQALGNYLWLVAQDQGHALWLKFVCSLNENEIEHFLKVSSVLLVFRQDWQDFSGINFPN